MLTGLTPHNASAAHFYRAAMEGATFTLKHGYDAFASAGMQFDRIVLTGGGASSAAWRQMVADVFDLTVEVPREAEGAAFGAALQALWSLSQAQGRQDSLARTGRTRMSAIDDALPAGRTPRHVSAYREPYHRFLEHLVAVQALYAA